MFRNDGIAILGLVILSGCGGAGSFQQPLTKQQPPPAVSITVTPSVVTVPLGGSRSFLATVIGTSNTTVTWTVQEGAAGGMITNAGLYVAPTSPGTFHVIATSAADPTNSASAVVNVAQLSGFFAPTGDMKAVVGIHTATLLPDGKVLMAGGSKPFLGIFGDDGSDETGQSDAELYDPVTGSFIATSNMGSPRTWHTATLLPNGDVLVTGGFDNGQPKPTRPQPQDSAELYNPETGSFTPAGTMGIARAAHTATLLPNGKVLIAGGGTAGGFGLPFFGQGIATAEVYDPATNSFSATGAMGTPRYSHTATLLPNGKVLIAGGISTANVGTYTGTFLQTAELYDPATGTFTSTGSLGTARGGHTATLLANGKVLIAGGYISLFADGGVSIASTAELYDPATGTFTPTGDLTAAREEHTATLLPDGRVLIAGGMSVDTARSSAEIYDPATGEFAATDNMAISRSNPSATLLPDGTVLVAGGNNGGGRHGIGLSNPTGTAELFKVLP